MEKIKIKTKGKVKFEIPNTEEWNNTQVRDLPFTTRALGVFETNNIHTLKDLKPIFSGMKLKKCGVTTKKNILETALQFYLDSLTDEQQIMYLLNMNMLNECKLDFEG